MKKKKVISLLLSATMAFQTGVLPVMADELTELQEYAVENSAEDSEPAGEDLISETVQEEVTVEENTVSEETQQESIDTEHADVKGAYTKNYLFALREDAEIPTEDSGISYLMKNVYMADTLEQIYESYNEEEILYVEENAPVELLDDQSDRYYGKQKKYLENVKAQSFWEKNASAKGVTVAVIDSGLYSGHVDFDQSRILKGYNYVNNDEDTRDSNGHGTQVAGVIAAVRDNGIGVAGLLDEVNILPMRVSANNSSSPTIAVVSLALNDAVDKYHVQVVNMSIGQKAESDTLKEAVEYAAAHNVILVAAAGNNGNDTLLYPAAYDDVIGVGALDCENVVRENSQKNDSVFVTAPGESIYTLDVNNKYTYKSGTSFSAPFVSAMAAAAKAENPDLTVAEFKELLIKTSVDAGEEGYDTSYGNGIVDIDAFLTEVIGTTEEPQQPKADDIAPTAQENAFALKYRRTYGSSLTDAFMAGATTKDGGYVAVGYTFGDSTDPEWTYHITPGKSPNANNDAIVVKFDSECRVEWARDFGSGGVDLFEDVAVLNDGTIVAVGRAPHAFKGTKTTVSGYVVRIAPRDPEDYEEVYVGGDRGGDFVQAVTATADGGYVIAGRTSSYDSEDWNKIHASSTTADAFIAKYDAEGNRQFSTCYNAVQGKRSQFLSVAEDNDGNIVAVGDHQVIKFVYNSQIVKFSGVDGSVLWSRSEGSALTEEPLNSNEGHTSEYESVDVLADGTYVTTGTTKTTGSTTGEKNWGIEGETDGIIVHYSTDGTVTYAENIGTAGGTVKPAGILASSDGGYYVYGQTSDDIYGSNRYLWNIKGATDTIVLKYQADDTLEWNESYGTENHGEWFHSMFETQEGGLVMVGETNANSSDGKLDASIWTNFDVEGDPISGGGDAGDETKVYADGIYQGSGIGFNTDGQVVVSVEVKDGAIKEVKLVSSDDTASYMRKATALLSKIPEKQSTDVDIVTGATYSSRGLKRAAKQALTVSEAVAGVMESIDAIGIVTLESETKIQEALTSYQTLPEEVQQYVSNKEILDQAQKELDALKNQDKLEKVEITKTQSWGYEAVRVTWKQQEKADGYRLYYKAGSAAKWSYVAQIKGGDASVYVHKGLTTGETYSYRLRAYKNTEDGKIYGEYSEISSAKPLPKKAELTAVKPSVGRTTLAWKKVSGASGYRVYCKVSKNGKWKYLTQTRKTGFTHRDVKKGQKIYYTVRAYRTVNGQKVYGAYAAAKTVTAK